MTQPTQSSPWLWPMFSSQYTLVATSDEAGPATLAKSRLPRILQSKRTRIALIVGSLAFMILVPLFIMKQSIFLDHDYAEDDDPITVLSSPEEPPLSSGVDWSRFAYSQYATNSAYLCNSLMFFASLHRLGSKADRLLMFPSSMNPDPNGTSDSQLLFKAQNEYGVKLVPIAVQHRSGGDPTWSDSYTKLLAFNQTQYDRVLALDSDSALLQHMDELFLLPPAPAALPRAYWLSGASPTLTTALILLQPSAAEFARVAGAIASASSGTFDMEIVNALYGRDCMVLPHRRYVLLTAEFRIVDADSDGIGKGTGHAAYLGNEYEKWDADDALREAKFLHFSDWPMPKPWLDAPDETVRDVQPKCVLVSDGEEDCRARELWLGFYSDFKARRQDVCGESRS